MAEIAARHATPHELLESAEDAPIDAAPLRALLRARPELTHVAVVHCETTTGVANPLAEIAEVVAACGRRLLIDAMSAFGVLPLAASLPFDAVAASSNKGLEGPPGIAFVLARTAALEASAGRATSLVLDLHDQWRGLESSGQWRFTPPTHVLLGLARALDELEAEGGAAARRARYEANRDCLVAGMRPC